MIVKHVKATFPVLLSVELIFNTPCEYTLSESSHEVK